MPTLRTQDVQHVTDKARALADQFKSVFTKENLNEVPFAPNKLPTVADITVSTEGVLKLLKELKINKASGPDEICPRMLRGTAEEILRDIFQQSLDCGELPEDWLLANIAALFKKETRLFHQITDLSP